MSSTDSPARVASRWSLDPAVTFLNHGSFGACPTEVLEAQHHLRARLERQPVRFFVRDLEGLLDAARGALAAFVGADAADLAFVPNATTGVNAVVRSLDFAPHDELLTTSHAYNACRNTLAHVASRARSRIVVADVPFPIASAEHVVENILAAVTPRTRLALIDHVTSPTGLIFPIARIVSELASRGVDTLVDAAHAPGMLPLDLRSLAPAYYTANCHKWICAPKGAAFLYVRRDKQTGIHPTTISHGANSERTDRCRFQLEFDWTGTDDPTAYLTVPEAIRFMGALLPGGWPELMEQNHRLALAARATLCDALDIPPPSPDEMVGSLATVPLPDGDPEPTRSSLGIDPLEDALLEQHGIQVPVITWPAAPRRLLRVSAQAYNTPSQYARLAEALTELLRR
jgi:isopenicillin-N epimerase